MKQNKIKIWMLILLIGFFGQSCTDESFSDGDTISEDFRGDRSGGNNGNGGNGNPPGNPNINSLPVAQLENDIAEEWTALLLELDRHAGGMRPNASARALAYIYLAAYETAVPGMNGYESNAKRLKGLTINRPNRSRNFDWELALNKSFAKVIDHFLLNVPSDLNDKIAALEAENEAAYSANLPDLVITNSINWGEYVADQVIDYSLTDTEAEAQIHDPQPTTYEPPIGAGYWTYSADPERALFPYWESVRTFVISPERTTTKAPIRYSSNSNSAYYTQMMEVYNENNEAKEEQNDQLHVAEFWSDDVEGLMMSPPTRQISIAMQLAEQYALDLEEALALYVKLGFSLNDAAVSTWKYKYEHMVMRPSNYIHAFIDDSFQTNLYRLVYWPNLSFPGYPSGHSCFASAAAGIFIDTFGEGTQFTDRTHEGRTEFLGAPRSYSSFREMADENGYSRIPLGVHIKMDCTEGLRLGYEISDAVNKLKLKRSS